VIQSWQVPIKAYGKARPRVTGRGTFMPRAYEQWKRDFIIQSPAVDIQPPYALSIVIVRAIPKSGDNRKRQPGEPCQAKPDGDNVIGSVMDALFEDDSAVTSGTWRKEWGREHMINITLTQDGTT
jgi:Holliday junction resolvase RusA-like endonuclease